MLLKGFPIIGLSGELVTRCSFHFSKLPLSMSLFRDESSLQKVRDSLKRRFRDPALADKIAKLDKSVRESRFQLEQIRKSLNTFSKEMARAGVVDDAVKQQQFTKKAEASRLEQEVSLLEANLAKAVNSVGNLVHTEAPVSQSEEHNKVVHTEGTKGKDGSNRLPYWKVFEKLDAVDMKRGQKLSGHRGYFLKGIGVRLASALTQMSLDFLEKKGFTLYQTPVMIRSEYMQECCQLNTLQEDMYKISGEDTVLIATSEQSMACMYRQQILTELPIKMGGYSSCFRKQAGAHGKDNQGIFRVHQFQKAEQFIICAEDHSEKHLQQMLKNSMEFYQQLKLPFQIVQIVTGQLNDAANRKFDLEAWFPHSGRYRQLVSVSNCTDYQSRMLDIKYRTKQSTKHVHMLNGTLCAIQRALCCVLETHAEEKGVRLPPSLAKYYGKELIEFVK